MALQEGGPPRLAHRLRAEGRGPGSPATSLPGMSGESLQAASWQEHPVGDVIVFRTQDVHIPAALQSLAQGPQGKRARSLSSTGGPRGGLWGGVVLGHRTLSHGQSQDSLAGKWVLGLRSRTAGVRGSASPPPSCARAQTSPHLRQLHKRGFCLSASLPRAWHRSAPGPQQAPGVVE